MCTSMVGVFGMSIVFFSLVPSNSWEMHVSAPAMTGGHYMNHACVHKELYIHQKKI